MTLLSANSEISTPISKFALLLVSICLFGLLLPRTLEAQGAEMCLEWGTARQLGQLDPEVIPEASGLAVSDRFPGRIYHVDDSAATIFVTGPEGQLLSRVSISDTDAVDVEDLALGPCGNTTCLFVADIGDNSARRTTIEVLVVEERADWPREVPLVRRISLRYPDGPQDAEALAVRPDGDILLISRELFPENSRPHARLYRMPAEHWTTAAPGDVLGLEYVAALELRRLASELPGRLISGMDISEDNRRLLVLTYANAVEFDLASINTGRSVQEPFVEGEGVKSIALRTLPQQEGIAYTARDRAFVYSTEAGRGSSPIMRVDCISDD